MSAELYREAVDPNGVNNPHSYALQMTGRDQRVLEVGCAVGHVTEHLVAAGNQVVGVEIDPSAAAEAARFAERVHAIDLDTTPVSSVESETFDVIILGDVLEHLRDPAAALRDSMNLLAPGGKVIISVPNVAHVDVRLMLLEGRWDYQGTGLLDSTHLRWFTKASLRALLDDVGLVATRLERVRIGRYGSDIDLDPDVPRDDVLAFIEADPEAYTFQFVVQAERRDNSATDTDGALADMATPERPSLDHAATAHALATEVERLRAHTAELAEHNAALQQHLDAWESSTLARAARPVRSGWRRIREIVGR